jgi:hypothetical protein
MNYDKYSDTLLAQQDTLPTDTIFKILIGYSWHELLQAEAANNTIKGNASNIVLKKDYVSTQKSRIAGRAYSLLKIWIGIKFHGDSSGLNLEQSYNAEEFFTWFVGDRILEKLENQIAEYKAPKRAIEFISYLNLSKIQEQDSVKKIDKTKKNIFPAPDGTKWKNVRIGLNKKVQITIAIGKAKSVFSLEEWKEVMPLKKSSKFLFRIIHSSGVFDKESFKEGAQKTNYNQYLPNLRKDLKSLFNIDEDPFKANKPSGHQTVFACHTEIMPSTESPSLSPEDNTPKGIKKQTDAYQ